MGEARETKEREFGWKAAHLLYLVALAEGEVGKIGERT